MKKPRKFLEFCNLRVGFNNKVWVQEKTWGFIHESPYMDLISWY